MWEGEKRDWDVPFYQKILNTLKQKGYQGFTDIDSISTTKRWGDEWDPMDYSQPKN
jgi:hypothetical protein